LVVAGVVAAFDVLGDVSEAQAGSISIANNKMLATSAKSFPFFIFPPELTFSYSNSEQVNPNINS
jgi:hypothetical protein